MEQSYYRIGEAAGRPRTPPVLRQVGLLAPSTSPPQRLRYFPCATCGSWPHRPPAASWLPGHGPEADPAGQRPDLDLLMESAYMRRYACEVQGPPPLKEGTQKGA